MLRPLLRHVRMAKTWQARNFGGMRQNRHVINPSIYRSSSFRQPGLIPNKVDGVMSQHMGARHFGLWNELKEDILKTIDDPNVKKDVEQLFGKNDKKKKSKKSKDDSDSDEALSKFKDNLFKASEQAKAKADQASKTAKAKADSFQKEEGKQFFDKMSSLFDTATQKKTDLEKKVSQTKEDLTDKAKSIADHDVVKESFEKTKKAKESAEKETQKAWADHVESKPMFQKVKDGFKSSGLLDGWGEAAKELFGNEKRRTVVQLTKPPTKTEESVVDSGPIGSAVMNVEQPKNTWQRVTESIRQAPLISEMLRGAAAANKDFAKTDAGKAVLGAKVAVSDTAFDLREKWETSQNPWVYRIAGWSDALFADTEIGNAVREVKRFDKDFDVYTFLQDLDQGTTETLITCYATGDNDTLRHILTEAAYAQVYADFTTRTAAGLKMDPTILDIQQPQLHFAKCEDKAPPVFLVTVNAQQIHCIYDRDGKICEGATDKVYMNCYMFAFQQQVDDDSGEMPWKVREWLMIPDIYQTDGKRKQAKAQRPGGGGEGGGGGD